MPASSRIDMSGRPGASGPDDGPTLPASSGSHMAACPRPRARLKIDFSFGPKIRCRPGIEHRRRPSNTDANPFPNMRPLCGMPIEVTAKTFEQIIEKGIVLIDWWAAWCGPCRAFAPVFERAAKQHPDIVFGKIDTEAENQLADTFEVHSIPTLMAFRDGVLVLAQPGALSPAALEQLIAQVRAIDIVAFRRRASEK